MINQIIEIQELIEQLPKGWLGRVRQAHGPHEQKQLIVMRVKSKDDLLQASGHQIVNDGRVYWDNERIGSNDSIKYDSIVFNGFEESDLIDPHSSVVSITNPNAIDAVNKLATSIQEQLIVLNDRYR